MMYDETPLTLRVQHEPPQPSSDGKGLGPDSNAPGHPSESSERGAVVRAQSSSSFAPSGAKNTVDKTTLDTQSCKLFVTEQRWSALFLTGGPSEKTRQALHLECQLQTPLQVVKSNSATLLAAALAQSTCKSYDELVNSSFKRVLSAVTTDDLRANHAAERELQEYEALHKHYGRARDVFGRIHPSCDVHKCHGIAKVRVDALFHFRAAQSRAVLTVRRFRFQEAFLCGRPRTDRYRLTTKTVWSRDAHWKQCLSHTSVTG